MIDRSRSIGRRAIFNSKRRSGLLSPARASTVIHALISKGTLRLRGRRPEAGARLEADGGEPARARAVLYAAASSSPVGGRLGWPLPGERTKRGRRPCRAEAGAAGRGAHTRIHRPALPRASLSIRGRVR